MRPLLDTHVLLWWLEGAGHLTDAQRAVIEAASEQAPLWVSSISLWEVATLAWLGRITLSLPLRDWLEQATAPPLVRRFGITPAIAAQTTRLPETFHRDPADRIIVATAMVQQATILTSDRRIVDAEIVPVVC